ncbi:hypothetical protein K438DRAFT_2138923, partial [Mycena galopus ATCC 62051]
GVIRKIGTIQRRLAWPLHKDDTLFRSGRPTGLNIYAPVFKTLVLILTICFGAARKKLDVLRRNTAGRSSPAWSVRSGVPVEGVGRCTRLELLPINTSFFWLMRRIQLSCLEVNWILKSIDCKKHPNPTVFDFYCMYKSNNWYLAIRVASDHFSSIHHFWLNPLCCRGTWIIWKSAEKRCRALVDPICPYCT